MELSDHKYLLSRLYIDEDRTLKDVMDYMKENHGIHASKGTYNRLFRRWEFRKNNRGKDWIWVNRRIEKRAALGKKSNVLRKGNLQDRNTIRKEIARHVTTYEKAQAAVATPETPEDFMIVTPAGSTPAQSTKDTPMADGIEVVSSETEARHQELLAKVMEDCGSFISIWAASGLAMNRHTILASYKTVAEWIVTDTWDSSSRPDIERLLPIVASDILYSTYRNDLTRLQLQLERLPRNISTDIIRTAMFIASAQGCIDVAETLFSRGVDIDSRDSKGQTCLHIAAIHNQFSMVSFLVNHNADVNKRRNDRQTVWSLVCESEEHEKISHLLIESGANQNVLITDASPLYGAAAGGHVGHVKLLLRQGVNPSIKTVFDWEPLHWAASNGHFEVVKLLVEAGADVNCLSDTETTPLELVGARWPAIKEYLENHGARLPPLEVIEGKWRFVSEDIDDDVARAILLELVGTVWPDVNEYLGKHGGPITLLQLARMRLPDINQYLEDRNAHAILLEFIGRMWEHINELLEDHDAQAILLKLVGMRWPDIKKYLEDHGAPARPLELVRTRWPGIKEYLENYIARATPPPPLQPEAHLSRSSGDLVRAAIQNSTLGIRLVSVPIQETNSGINTQMMDSASAPQFGNSPIPASERSAISDPSQDPISSFSAPLGSIGSPPMPSPRW
ncbi:hypothetical protein DTO282F9_6230 [Paecilomyces variotii]|nr:hypothetical protein DTO282F9_6230 [Paecilomyces variotii]